MISMKETCMIDKENPEKIDLEKNLKVAIYTKEKIKKELITISMMTISKKPLEKIGSKRLKKNHQILTTTICLRSLEKKEPKKIRTFFLISTMIPKSMN